MTDVASPTPAPPPADTTDGAADTSEDAGDDPLRLTQCPGCNYPLEGLPPAGRCPECGEAYDDERLPYAAWNPGHHRALAVGLRWTLIGWSLMAAFVLVSAISHRSGRGSVTAIVLSTIGFAAAAGWELHRRRRDALLPPTRACFTPSGCGQAPRRKAGLTLTPWGKISKVAIVPETPDAYRVTCHLEVWQWSWSWSNVPVDVELRCTAAGARALESRIAKWHPPTRKRLEAAEET